MTKTNGSLLACRSSIGGLWLGLSSESVYWWLVGRGIEALIAAFRGGVRPSINYVETAIAVLFALLGAVLFLGPLLDPTSLNGEISRLFFILAGAMWILLGSATIAAQLAQWRIRRRSAAQANGNAVPA